MKIGWLDWDTITSGKENASSRVRCHWVKKHMPNSFIGKDINSLLTCDAVINRRLRNFDKVEHRSFL